MRVYLFYNPEKKWQNEQGKEEGWSEKVIKGRKSPGETELTE